ncbi:disrupter of silencing SAS10 part of small subunit processosome something about silencing 10 [Scheffersomyces xylosifermentans]|uniref:disrupter of silencing SAS10 part of small subunit processosome something about silencing 10 n=1 Tax=Scheffersomyces xylosifermentans TaxID=1304137 RepID=UPI00315DD8EA
MARKSGRKQASAEEDHGLDEVDAFDANKEKILLDNAGEYAARFGEEDELSSEEEVLGGEVDNLDDEESEENEENEDGSDVDSDALAEEQEQEEEEDEERGWGGKKNYYGGDDASDDEDARQMTEEALKQQKKHLNELAMDDFIDEDMMDDWKKTSEEQAEADAAAQKTQLVISEGSTSIENLDDEEKLKLLNQSFPEFVPLLKELNLLKPQLAELQSKPNNQFIEVKSVALAAYLAAITSYFAIFVDSLRSGEPFTTMKENPVMETILSSREVWRQASELPEVADEKEKTDEFNEEFQSVENSDMSELESDIDVNSEEDDEEEFVDAQEEQNDDLDIDITSKRRIKRVSKNRVSDFTEVATPEDVDMEEKQRRKKTLRFYTSKIDQAVAKGNDHFSGDLDLPYRERLFERQQRLIEEARKRGLDEKDDLGADLDGEDFGSDDERLAHEVNNGEDNAYYQSLKEGKQEKKESRLRAHEEAVKAAKEGKLAEVQESLGEDGKRAINYQILKNKGLTPHRKKEYRNSRVKKRKQYEKAQKKLKSVRQVYDASNRGPYGGEKTGIKKGLSRSVKLV